jgi:hypothetical protein
MFRTSGPQDLPEFQKQEFNVTDIKQNHRLSKSHTYLQA